MTNVRAGVTSGGGRINASCAEAHPTACSRKGTQRTLTIVIVRLNERRIFRDGTMEMQQVGEGVKMARAIVRMRHDGKHRHAQIRVENDPTH